MSTHNIYFMIKYEKSPKISINICFLRLSREFPRDSKRVRISHGNEPSMFESLRFYL